MELISMLKKILEFLKKIPDAYYNWKKRNEDLTKFLADAKTNFANITRLNSSIEKITNSINNINSKIDKLEG
jgi:predicted  nucleic acid-binding Zn-ribbon protein